MAARRAHNPKVTGSSPVPATKFLDPFLSKKLSSISSDLIAFLGMLSKYGDMTFRGEVVQVL